MKWDNYYDEFILLNNSLHFYSVIYQVIIKTKTTYCYNLSYRYLHSVHFCSVYYQVIIKTKTTFRYHLSYRYLHRPKQLIGWKDVGEASKANHIGDGKQSLRYDVGVPCVPVQAVWNGPIIATFNLPIRIHSSRNWEPSHTYASQIISKNFFPGTSFLVSFVYFKAFW